MPFLEKVGFIFNCGFAAHWCVSTYKHCAKIDQNGDSAEKKSEEASGKKNKGDSSGKPSLNFTETF